MSTPEPTAEAQPFIATIQGVWARLKAHKVVQWTLAYLAIAYTLLHGAEMLAGSLNWSHGLLRIFTLILILGVPVIITLAWYHGARGQQRVSGTEVMIIALLLALGGAFLWRDSTDHEQAAEPAVGPVSTADPSDETDTRPSIAVLPFENRSRLEDDAVFVDGMHDDILTQLSKVSALRVISRTSVQRFRNSGLSIGEIAKQLGVKSILEGGVQRAGGTVRIHVQLIDAGSDAHLWGESYDRELTATNIFTIQSDIAGAIASALEASLTATEHARISLIPTRSLQAWQSYQLGKQQEATRIAANLFEAERHFRRAIESDPEFALAWVGLANAVTLQTSYADRPRIVGLRDSELALAQALKLDPNLAEAWASAGHIAYSRQQYADSERKLKRAIKLNPNFATAYQWLANTLFELGRLDEALAAAEHAIVLDPLSAVINVTLGNSLRNLGRNDDALVAYEQAISIDPTMPLAYFSVGDTILLAFGRLDQAAPWYEKAAVLDPDSPHIIASVADVYWQLGDEAEADRWLARMLVFADGTAYSNAVAATMYLDRGDIEKSRKYALASAELDSWTLPLVRDHDLRTRNYAAARARYAQAFPELFADQLPAFRDRSTFAAIDLALVLQHTGEQERATMLLNRGEAYLRTVSRMGYSGYAIYDVCMHALRGDKSTALAKLREAYQAGWRNGWRYARDFEPNLASIRSEPEFKSIFADIERDIAAQRARLAARPKDAPLVMSATTSRLTGN